MSLILNIDTALDRASVCLAQDDRIFQKAVNENQKDHASWLHPAINELLQKNKLAVHDLNAVAVSIGPGSYTGLRIGLSAAKGFCYALSIPLIAVSSLKILASAVKEEATDLIVPLIDARRMEVFMAVYDKNMEEKMPAQAMIADESSFVSLLISHKILFCGNGAEKVKKILSHDNALFSDANGDATNLARLSFRLFQQNEFADLAYTEPLYVKEFYSASFKK